MKPLISIIVPIYNTERYLNRCVDSIINQTFRNFELILVDDGSPDNSPEICDEYAKEDTRIKVIHKENGGVSSARNCGIDKAQGNYMMFCDSDDWISINALEDLISVLKKNPKTELIIFNYKKVSDEINENNFLFEREEIHYKSKEALKEMLSGDKFRMLACNKLYKKNLFDYLRFPIKRSYGEDAYVTYHVLSQAKEITYINSSLYYYFNNPTSALNKKITLKNLELFDTYDEMILFITEEFPEISDLAYKAYVIRIFDFFLRIINENSFKRNDNLRYCLQKKIKKHLNKILCCKGITIKQKMLLMIYCCNSNLFFKIYSKRIRKES